MAGWVVPVFCFVTAMCGFYTYMTNYEQNACTMTYMFEYPEYKKISFKSDVQQKYPRYSLYVYGEGQYAQDLKNNKITGIPVLFVPGNSGSYKQVRSIASLAMRMGHSLRSKFHFNVFAIDFNEEFSGLYGGVLKDETEFVKECIERIQSIYSTKKRLFIIGHSMGGVIARAVCFMSQFDCSYVSAMFTLASPHKESPLLMDSAIADYFSEIQIELNNQNDKEASQIPLVSVAGGERDVVVRTDMTTLPTNDNMNYHVVSTAIPGVWISVDHLAIVWCKQLVLTIARTMFDLIDHQTGQITTNLTHTQSILNHHFIQRSYGKHFLNFPFVPAQFFPHGEWIEQQDSLWRFSRTKIFSAVHLLVPLFDNEFIMIMVVGIEKPNWLFACKTNNSTNNSARCSDGINLSEHADLAPGNDINSYRRVVHLNSSGLLKDGLSHVLVFISATDSKVNILGERYLLGERMKNFSMPSVPQRLVSLHPVSLMNFALSLRSVFYNFSLSDVSRIMESATFLLETRICSGASVDGQSFMVLHVPWSRENRYFPIKTKFGSVTSIPIKFQVLAPKGDNRAVQLHLYLNPDCSFKLTATFPKSNIISQFIKYYGIYVISYVTAMLISLIGDQLYEVGAGKKCPHSIYLLGKYHTFFSLVVLPIAFHYLSVDHRQLLQFLPEPDDISIENSCLLTLFGIRCILYATAQGFLLIVITVVHYVIAAWSHFVLYIRKKYFVFQLLENKSEPPLKFNVAFPDIAIMVILQVVSVYIAGSLALLLGFVFIIFKLLMLCTKCMSDEERRGVSPLSNKWHFQFALTIMWFMCVAITFTATMAWYRNSRFLVQLTNDPHKIPSAVLITASFLMWYLSVPSSYSWFYKPVSYVIEIIAFLVTIYSIKNVFRVLHFLTLTYAVLGLHQLFSTCFIGNQKKVD